MLNNYQHTTAERMMRYAVIDTTANPDSDTQPSSKKQLDLSRLLVSELKAMGIDVELDEYGYVYATIKGNSKKKVPVLCFCSHVDTAPDCSGANVKPILHKKWNGEDIVLPDDKNVVISSKKHPYLLEKIGDDIITASGFTLLGADDKAGISIIMDFAQYLLNRTDIIHGDIRILFTPDEEIGRGVNKVDMKKLNADFGYTLDGGECGTLEGENFSADSCTVTFNGISAHPGYAKGKMVNAQKVLAHFITLLPNEMNFITLLPNEMSPENTEAYEGFVHPVSISGGLEAATVTFILRDFVTSKLSEQKQLLNNLAEQTIKQFPGAGFTISSKEQYRNMDEVLQKHPEVMDNACEAFKRSGINCVRKNIRGGTDCEKISEAGQMAHAFHLWACLVRIFLREKWEFTVKKNM